MTVSCIIPAYNEGPRIAGVLEVVSKHPSVDEVIVVDDASGDDTALQAARFDRVRVIRQPRNRGKSAAVAAGLRVAQGEVIVFLDSDLLGLDAQALHALIHPVTQGQADATVSLRGNAPRLWHWLGLDYLSGERAMRRALAPMPDALERLPRFGMEVHMNGRWLTHGAELAIVPWPKVASPYKSAKRGALRGAIADLAMVGDIISTVGAMTPLHQIWAMRFRLAAKPKRLSDALPSQPARTQHGPSQNNQRNGG